MIKINNLAKKFADNTILQDINLEVGKEEVLALIGFSGSGKSTILKIISGLEQACAGSISLASENLGMCFQYSALFDSMTVAENIAFPLRNSPENLSKTEISEMVSEKLAVVGLAGIENLYPSELSGGMKKRVGFARAIISDPEIILYDEPTAGLDPVASTIIEDIIVGMQSQTRAASIVVTHQKSTILRTATKVAMLYDSKIVWTGSPEELFDTNNQNKFCEQFRMGNITGPMVVNA